MSPHLHIPLSRHQKTTRRPRWVVWLLAAFFLLSVLLCFHVAKLWFTRSSAFKAAPQETEAAVQLFLNKKTWPVLSTVLKNTSLISNRNLTLLDISPFIHGEIIWFFGKDGSRSVAIRSNEDEIPTELLDAQHIVIQKVSQNIFLFSEKLQPISGVSPKKSFRNLLPSFSHQLGMYFDENTRNLSQITYVPGRISFSIPEANASSVKIKASDIPSGVYLFLSTPVSTNQNQFLDLPNIFSTFLSNPGFIVLKDAAHPTFLLTSQQQMDEKERVRLIQTALSLKYPQKEKKTLDDRTTMQEIISDPSLVSVEQRTVSGKEFHHATTGSTSLFISKSGEIILSDDESLLKSWLSKQTGEYLSDICNGNIAFLSLKDLLETNSYPKEFYSHEILQSLSDSINAVSMESSGKRTKVHLCY